MRKMAVLLLAGLLAMFAGCAAPASDQAGVASTQPDDSGALTVQNNADLAALLSGPSTGKSVEAFSEKYRVTTVEFDGFVSDVYINPRDHNGASTIDVMAGDASDLTHTGPVFQLSWYGHESPMEKFAKGDNVHVTALVGMVYEFDPHQFFLVEDEEATALTQR